MKTRTKIFNILTSLVQSQTRPKNLTTVRNNMPAGRPRQEAARIQSHLPAFPDPRRQDVRIEDVTRIVLFELMGKNLHQFAILEQVGRIVLVSYQPHNQHDPILPVPLIRLSPRFNAAYKNLASVLSSWVDAMFRLYYAVEAHNNFKGGYSYNRPNLPRPVITENYTNLLVKYGNEALAFAAAERSLFTEQEWNYFFREMKLSIARPDRFTDYDNAQMRDIWNKAVAYNIALSK